MAAGTVLDYVDDHSKVVGIEVDYADSGGVHAAAGSVSVHTAAGTELEAVDLLNAGAVAKIVVGTAVDDVVGLDAAGIVLGELQLL